MSIAAPGPAAAVDLRWQKLVLAAELAWVGLLLMELITPALSAIHPLRNDYLGNIVDVPKDLAAYFPALDTQVIPASQYPSLPGGFYRMGIAAMPADNLMPAVGYKVMTILAALSAVIAAVRGRWILHCMLLGLMMLPAQPFGAGTAYGQVSLMIVAGAIAVLRAFAKKEWRPLIPILALTASVYIGQSTMASMTRMHPAIVLELPDSPRAEGQMILLRHALNAVPEARKPSADYVRAQVAYIRKDWPELKRIGSVHADTVPGTPYKGARTYVLNEALRQLSGGPPETPERTVPLILSRVVDIGLLLTGIGLTVTNGWLRRRLKRIDRLTTELAGMRRAHTA